MKKVPCEIYSRVCGYFRPVFQNWNPGKIAEFKDRVTYDPNKQTPPVRGSASMRMELVAEGVIVG